ncbi:hypothetical protein C8R43DRAFT_924179 [Mycena crocata]|nr:hypothetical protein C8R43DRAFT_924179 [Mycena crocata]
MPHHCDNHSSSSSSSRRYKSSTPAPSAALQLPRNLARPQFTDVSRDALAAASPELASVPAEFIRHGLRTKTPQMMAGISALAPSHLPTSLPRSHLPPALTIPIRSVSSSPHPSYPTHALAIGSSSSKHGQALDAHQSLFPVHAVVLTVHCAKLPRLPPPARSSSSRAVLPVCPIALPSPQAFSILHAFMYTHRLDAALSALLPLPSSFIESLAASYSSASARGAPTPIALIHAVLSAPQMRHALSAHLCASAAGNVNALLAHAGHVKELWQDMVALGLYDAELWDALDLSWEVVLGGLNLAAQ